MEQLKSRVEDNTKIMMQNLENENKKMGFIANDLESMNGNQKLLYDAENSIRTKQLAITSYQADLERKVLEMQIMLSKTIGISGKIHSDINNHLRIINETMTINPGLENLIHIELEDILNTIINAI